MNLHGPLVETFALDTVRTVSRTTFDISDIPAHIVKLHREYHEASEIMQHDPFCRTPAQKRMITLRFNKLCAAIEAAGLHVPNTLVRMTNA